MKEASMIAINEPKFNKGDKVFLNISRSLRKYLTLYFGRDFAAFASRNKEKFLEISSVHSSTDLHWYYVKGYDKSILEKYLQKLKDSEPKFKIGDWVMLRSDIYSLQSHILFSTIMDFHDDMFKWKNRFMKITDAKQGVDGWAYQVKENIWDWHESWLEKVE
jgi:hypothetical protein